MRIEDLRSKTSGDRARVAATVVWEDCDRDPQEVFYETSREFAADLSCDPHAFLVGAVLPAIACGEKRLAIDAAICPELRTGVPTAISWLRKWGLVERSISIEARAEARYPHEHQPRAGLFISGGVDSLALIRANRLDFPTDHPRAFRDGLFVHGFDIGGLAAGEAEMASYDLALRAVAAVAQDAGIVLIPVFTNVRHLYDAVPFWIYQFHGAAMAAVAHAFSNRLTHVSIASAYKIAELKQKTTHPLLEPNFGSTDLRFEVGAILYSRLERVGLLTEWQVALDNLRVCTFNPPGRLNCGACEKCVRTMLQLLVLDSLEKTMAFGAQDVRPEMLEVVQLTEKYQDGWYAELIAPLTARGRRDLVEVIERKRAAFHKQLAWEEERDWKGAVKRLDRKVLRGALYKTYSLLRNGAVSPP
jgi:hypothetical protein